MSDSTNQLYFRKFAPIDRANAIYELLDGDQVLLDVSASDDGVFEVAMHNGVVNKVFDYDKFVELLSEGRRLVEEDMKA